MEPTCSPKWTNIPKVLVILTGLQTFGVSSNENIMNFQPATNLINLIQNLLSGDVNFDQILLFLTDYKFINLTENSRLCINDVTTVFRSVLKMEEWALSMLDAFGKPGSSILDGNLNFAGSYDECLKVNNDQILFAHYCWLEIPIDEIAATVFNDSNVKHIGESKLRLREAMCIPRTCDKESIKNIVEIIKEGIEKMGYFKPELPSITINCIESPLKNLSKDTWTLIVISVLCTLILLMIVGTGLELVLKNRKSTTHFEMPFLMKLLLCFSAYSNGNKFFQLEHAKNYFPEINGMRVLTMTWVIFIHTKFDNRPLDNSVYLVQTWGSWLYQIIAFNECAVDIFFAITGFLTMNAILQKSLSDKFPNASLGFVCRYILARYWRMALVPGLYLFFFQTGLTHYLGSGPFWGEMNTNCRSDWWKNMLFISNWYPETTCQPHWWFMSASMQLHVLSLFIVVPIVNKRNKLAILNGSLILVICWIWMFQIAYRNDYYPNYAGMVNDRSKAGIFISAKYQSLLDVLNHTLHHCGSYFSGTLASWIIFKNKDTIVLNKMQLIFCWCLWSAVAYTSAFFMYHEPSKLLKSFFLALVVTFEGLCIAWIFIACNMKDKGILSSFFSWKGWLPLSKLTLTVYLIHGSVLEYYSKSELTPSHYTETLNICWFIRNVVVVYMVAIPVSLIIEAPVDAITNLIKKSGSHEKFPINIKSVD